MRKVIMRPDHIVDLDYVYFKLDGETLTLEVIPTVSLMQDPQSLSERFRDFDQVGPDEFNALCEKQASKESIELFKQKYKERYGV